MKIMNIVTAAAFAALAFSAQAQTTKGPDRIDKRQENQERRIQEGVNKGDLTKKEAARLERQQANIRKMEEKARADGKVTAKERRQIERAQDRASKDIERERHDKQRAKK